MRRLVTINGIFKFKAYIVLFILAQVCQDSGIKDIVFPTHPFDEDETDSVQFIYSCIKTNMTVQSVREMKRLLELFTNKDRASRLLKRNDQF